jgi:hypothetical protein
MLYNSWPQEESSSCKLRGRTTGEFNNNLKRLPSNKAARIDYETLDRLIDSVTREFSRKAISSRLETLARKSRNATTICDHIFAEQTEHNIKASIAQIKVKSKL